jgi:flagellar basal-body rod protein FlgF
MAEITAQVGSSINALTQEFSIIANNMANVNTAGFKRRCTDFVKSLMELQNQPAQESTGTVELHSAIDFSQGSMAQTGGPLDFAISGNGFFVIETPEGTRYTRDGGFHLNQNGQIVDSGERIVAGQAGPITVPSGVSPSQLNVGYDGTISADGAAIGKFQIVDFKENESKLTPVGLNCLMMPDENVKPVAADKASVRQGYQESSNVKIIDELVDLIMVSRLYEANMKLINAGTEASNSIMSVAMG